MRLLTSPPGQQDRAHMYSVHSAVHPTPTHCTPTNTVQYSTLGREVVEAVVEREAMDVLRREVVEAVVGQEVVDVLKQVVLEAEVVRKVGATVKMLSSRSTSPRTIFQ